MEKSLPLQHDVFLAIFGTVFFFSKYTKLDENGYENSLSLGRKLPNHTLYWKVNEVCEKLSFF